MYANHPALAKRWEAVTRKDQGLPARLGQKHPTNPHSESNESPAPAGTIDRHTAASDFKNLSPSASARFAPSSAPRPNQQESDREKGVQYVRRAAIHKRRKG